MNKLIISFALLLLLAVSAHAAPNAAQAFNAFKAQYNKQYDDPQQEARRFQIFQENMLLAEKLNKEHNSDAFGIESPFADMSQDEFAMTYLMDSDLVMSQVKDIEPNVTIYQPSGFKFPPEPEALPFFDWAQRGVSTGVKNQGQCGSCWAFAAATVLESRWAIAGRGLPTLSTQQLVDCTYANYNGCNGGWYGTAWQYVQRAGGEAPESSYPYQAAYGGCRFNPGAQGVAARTTGVAGIAGEGALLNYVYTTAPAAVAVDATYFYLYRGGVFPASSCRGQINHAVTVTGFANVGGMDVWRIRNSWGAGWGDQGYVYLQLGVNPCSIGNYAQAVMV